MKVVIVFEPISRSAICTIDGSMETNMLEQVGPALDNLVYTVSSKGWTFLLGSRDRSPQVLTPNMALRYFKSIEMANQYSQGPDQSHLVEDQPEGSTEEKRAAMFRKWVDDSNDPGPDSEPDPA